VFVLGYCSVSWYLRERKDAPLCNSENQVGPSGSR
jgi:hypothetical protein